MTIEEKDKYAYELMVKNNPDEAVKQLILKDNLSKLCKILSNDLAESNKIVEELKDRINKAIEYIEKLFILENDNVIYEFKNDEIKPLLKILKGEE